MKRRTLLATAAASVIAPMGAEQRAVAAPTIQAWQPRWAPSPAVHGLGAFEGLEDDRANSHPAGQPHITVQGDTYRFVMHMVDRDTMTDRQRQEVKGMMADGGMLILNKGETWRLAHEMFIPTSLKATTSFTHIMQTKAPGAGSLPMITMSLRRHSNVQKIELVAGGVTVGMADLVPLQNKWIDVELEMVIGDSSTGKVGDSSGSLQECYLLTRNMRADEWSGTTPPPGKTVYQAENATISQGVVESNHTGFTGTGFVNLDNIVGSYVQFAVNAATSGTATLTFRYANGSTAARPMDIAVNGTLVANDLRASAGGPNLDHLEVQLTSSAAEYQAENAVISQGVVESNHAGMPTAPPSTGRCPSTASRSTSRPPAPGPPGRP